MVGIDCLCCEAVSGLVRPIQFLSNGNHLSSLEVGDLDRPPALCGADHGAEHGLRTAFSPKALGMIFMRRRSSTNKRSRRFVVRMARRWGDRWAMQASRSSMKQLTALGTPSQNRRRRRRPSCRRYGDAVLCHGPSQRTIRTTTATTAAMKTITISGPTNVHRPRSACPAPCRRQTLLQHRVRKGCGSESHAIERLSEWVVSRST